MVSGVFSRVLGDDSPTAELSAAPPRNFVKEPLIYNIVIKFKFTSKMVRTDTFLFPNYKKRDKQFNIEGQMYF